MEKSTFLDTTKEKSKRVSENLNIRPLSEKEYRGPWGENFSMEIQVGRNWPWIETSDRKEVRYDEMRP